MKNRVEVLILLVCLVLLGVGCQSGHAKEKGGVGGKDGVVVAPGSQVKEDTVKLSGDGKNKGSSGEVYKMGAKDATTSDLSKKRVPKVGEKITRTEEEWRQLLTPEQYHIMRQKGTERAWTGPLNGVKVKEGVFHCAACNAPLFKAETKYESGSGWPSFYDKLEGRVELHDDSSLGMQRVEVVCATCGAHLGHVFDDGPNPTGKRYCINSAALNYASK